MLKTATDFEDSILFLNSNITKDTFNNFKYQSTVMDSDDHNLTMKDIESKLNSLYEKSRILEDVIAYTREFLEQNIYDTTKECKSILDNIEDNRDSLKTSAYISYDVQLSESTGSYADRDRTELSRADIHNGMVTLSGVVNTDVSIQSITKTNTYVPYRTNIEELNAGKNYRVFYFLDQQVTGGLKETIKLVFASAVTMNYLDIIPANCKVTRVSYIHSNDFVENIDMTTVGIVKDRTVKAIEFDIVCELYKKETYTVDTLNMAANYWDSVTTGSYDAQSKIILISGNEFKSASLVELDARFGSDRVFRDYSDYLMATDGTQNDANKTYDYSTYTNLKETESSAIASSINPSFPIPIKITKTYEFETSIPSNITPTISYGYGGRLYTLWTIGSYSYLGPYVDSYGKTMYRFQQMYGATLNQAGSSVLIL